MLRCGGRETRRGQGRLVLGESVPRPSPRFWWFPGNLPISCACRSVTSSASVFTWHSPHAHTCVCNFRLV